MQAITVPTCWARKAWRSPNASPSCARPKSSPSHWRPRTQAMPRRRRARRAPPSHLYPLSRCLPRSARWAYPQPSRRRTPRLPCPHKCRCSSSPPVILCAVRLSRAQRRRPLLDGFVRRQRSYHRRGRGRRTRPIQPQALRARTCLRAPRPRRAVIEIAPPGVDLRRLRPYSAHSARCTQRQSVHTRGVPGRRSRR